jgi:predicted TIM-barrel fold metal-dependent hydrolase
VAREARPDIGPIVDCNVHLWDQRDNPVFWLSDRTLVRDMLGDYDIDYCAHVIASRARAPRG